MPLIHSPCWTLQASSCHVVLTMWCMTVDILVCVLTVTLGICNIPSPSELDLAQPFLLLTDSTAGSVLSHCFPCQSAQPEPSGSAVTQHTGSPSGLVKSFKSSQNLSQNLSQNPSKSSQPLSSQCSLSYLESAQAFPAQQSSPMLAPPFWLCSGAAHPMLQGLGHQLEALGLAHLAGAETTGRVHSKQAQE